ncbi:membrane-associated protein [Motilibacter rhizosphaerae]|uniref:Membrane-associated protein n=1 Tax=Motilibacter rhizosphaerae TaxID=598652 RepID=A0A4Q7NUQ9_9ACTN|nr:DedA family protein [Motilibacter rhizosphaerae]RZS90943.1 membrane-associated protein [Motilibacter rhizosphaerae]
MDLLPDLGSVGTLGAYALVGALVFVESGLLLGFLLPGDTVLFGAGLLAGDPGSGVELGVLLPLVLVTAVAGEALGYAIGRRLGRPWLERRMQSGRLDPRHLARAEAFTQRFGWWAVVAARWVPWMRTFVPLLAGVSGMGQRSFTTANVVGAASWGGVLVLAGYAAAGDPRLRTAALVVGAVAVVGSLCAGAVLHRRRR